MDDVYGYDFVNEVATDQTNDEAIEEKEADLVSAQIEVLVDHVNTLIAGSYLKLLVNEASNVTVTKRILPTTTGLKEMGPELRAVRSRYWVKVCLFTYMATVVVGTLLMRVGSMVHFHCRDCPGLGNERSLVRRFNYTMLNPNTTWLLQDTTRGMVIIIFIPYYFLVVGISAWSASTKRLSNTTGLDWEMYWVVLIFLSVLNLVQAVLAVVVRADAEHKFGWFAFGNRKRTNGVNTNGVNAIFLFFDRMYFSVLPPILCTSVFGVLF